MTTGAAAAEPEATPTPVPADSRLGDVAHLMTLDAASLDHEGGSPVITNDTVNRLADRGVLTIGPPLQHAPTLELATGTVSQTKLREKWRRRVFSQRSRIAGVEAELAGLDAKIDALEDTALAASTKSKMKVWIRIDEARKQREIVKRRLGDERSKLATIIREARKEGAQPGWFR